MSEELNGLNGLDARISLRGYFERLMGERDKLDAERDRRIDERFALQDKALELQATEYSRRLHDLNGEYQRDRARQHEYVTTDKWEATNKAEATARANALVRVDEKFEDYIKRYEVRQREVDVLLAAQAGAADQARRAVEEQARKSNRNLGFASFGLGALVFFANFVPEVLK